MSNAARPAPTLPFRIGKDFDARPVKNFYFWRRSRFFLKLSLVKIMTLRIAMRLVDRLTSFCRKSAWQMKRSVSSECEVKL